jgi:hypothetical protein
MATLEEEQRQLERRRRELAQRAYWLWREMEDLADRPRRTSGFPFSVLERAVGRGLTFLERQVSRLVTAVLSRRARR